MHLKEFVPTAEIYREFHWSARCVNLSHSPEARPSPNLHWDVPSNSCLQRLLVTRQTMWTNKVLRQSLAIHPFWSYQMLSVMQLCSQPAGDGDHCEWLLNRGDCQHPARLTAVLWGPISPKWEFNVPVWQSAAVKMWEWMVVGTTLTSCPF
jgi:hypothetical protein